MALAAGLALNFQGNQVVIEKANVDNHYRRAAMVLALNQGILDDVPTESIIVLRDEYRYDPWPTVRSPVRQWAEGGYPWLSAGLIHQYTGRRFRVLADSEARPQQAAKPSTAVIAAENQYALTIRSHPDAMRDPKGFVELTVAASAAIDFRGPAATPERLLRRTESGREDRVP